MSQFGRMRGDPPLLPLSERLYRRFFPKYHGRYLITELQLRARQRHEWRAFQEFIRDTGLDYRYLGFAQKNGHVAVRLSEESDAASQAANAGSSAGAWTNSLRDDRHVSERAA